MLTVAKKSLKNWMKSQTVKEGKMPLKSYTVIHQDAILSAPDQDEIEKWVNQIKREIK